MKLKKLSKAIEIAMHYHKGQFDRGGMPYILHCIQVANFCYIKDDEDLKCIAVLHDILEDTTCTINNLIENGFNDRVINGIKALTKSKDMSSNEYLLQILKNDDAIKVKLADLQHNLDTTRLPFYYLFDVKTINRLKKYKKFYIILTNAYTSKETGHYINFKKILFKLPKFKELILNIIFKKSKQKK